MVLAIGSFLYVETPISRADIFSVCGHASRRTSRGYFENPEGAGGRFNNKVSALALAAIRMTAWVSAIEPIFEASCVGALSTRSRDYPQYDQGLSSHFRRNTNHSPGNFRKCLVPAKPITFHSKSHFSGQLLDPWR